MPLPDSYTLKPGSIPAYFDAMLDAQAPERFSIKFLENLGFTSTNDRLLIGVLKDLGFLNSDGAPQQRYFEFLDRSRSKNIIADAIREAYSDLFAVNTKANELNTEEVTNKLRTLYTGKKSDDVVSRVARTFTALCEYADFSKLIPQSAVLPQKNLTEAKKDTPADSIQSEQNKKDKLALLQLGSLQYQINIVLPESRDQSVYDAIFKSLREHLG